MDDARETEEAGTPPFGDESSIGKRRGTAMTVVAGLALVAVLGGAVWASGALSGLSDPAAQKPVAEQVGSADKREHGVTVSVKADGWTDAVGPFDFAAVGEDGAVAKEDEVKPGENVSLKLAGGVYLLPVISIPTAADGRTTWSLPAEISFILPPVDPGDEAAVEAVIAALPRGGARDGPLPSVRQARGFLL